MGAESSKHLSAKVSERDTSAYFERPRLPEAFIQIAKNIEDELPEVQIPQQVPDIIKHNRAWSLLSPHIKSVPGICWYRHKAVVLVTLDDGNQLVVKGCSAERAKEASAQFDAELKVAASFACHPFMATVVASCQEETGSICLMTPYAGVSVADIIQHPDWRMKLTEQERTEVFAEMATHGMAVHEELQREGRRGFFYRDTKPENTTFHPAIGQFKIIDYGLAMQCYGLDFHSGCTIGRFTPEMVKPALSFYRFWTGHGQLAAVNHTTDVFLIGQEGLQMIRGLPKRLQPCHCDLDDTKAVEHILMKHHKANYPGLIKRVESPQARDFLLQAMTVDPDLRLTPSAALQHPFLASRAAVVHTRVAETLTSYTWQVCHILHLMAPLQGQPGVFLATHHQQQWDDVPPVTTLGEVPRDQIQTECEDICANSTSESEDDLAPHTSSPNNDICVGISTNYEVCGVESTLNMPASADDSAAAADGGKAKSQLGSSLLKVFKRLRSFQSKTGRHKQKSCTRAAPPVVAGSGVDAGVEAEVVTEPIGGLVPGICGFRWFGSRSRASSKKALDKATALLVLAHADTVDLGDAEQIV